MRNKKHILGIVILFMIAFSNISVKGNDIKLFDDIIELNNGSIEEVGVRATFNIGDYGKEAMKKVFDELSIKDVESVEFSKDHGNDILKFRGENVSGSIENLKEEKGSTIVLNITEKTSINNIEEIKDNIRKSITSSNKNIKYSYYIKSKLSTSDVADTNKKILNYLTDIGSTNLDSIEINNGFSTVGFTKHFDSIDNGGKLIDFNYAVVTYSSGTYMLLGTPILMIPY